MARRVHSGLVSGLSGVGGEVASASVECLLPWDMMSAAGQDL